MEIKEYKTMYEVEDSHFWYRGMRMITKSLFDKYLHCDSHLQILDAGCGTGRNLIFLKNYGRAHGLDISAEAIRFCKRRGLQDVVIGSIERLPFDDNSFDLITSFDVLYHKKVINHSKAIEEFYRVLKPEGIIFIRVPAFQFLLSSHDLAVYTKHRFHKAELRDIIEFEKFEILKISYINFLLFPVIALKRIFIKSLSLKNNQNSDTNRVNILLNFFLLVPLYLESLLIKYIDFPFGLSLIVMARKKK